MACSSIYCIKNTGLPSVDDTYEINGTYNGYDYWSGYTNGWVIYYSTGTTSQWCLSDTLGGVCTLAGKTPCVSSCPDLCETYLYSGVCPTPTPTPTQNCNVLDFNAVFDCEFVVTSTPTPTPSITPTLTPTPTTTNVCGGVTVDSTIIRFSPSPTPTPTNTPTPSGEIIRNCNFSGNVIFNLIDDELICPGSLWFQDCINGDYYYTNNPTLPIGVTLELNMVYGANVITPKFSNTSKCIIYLGQDPLKGNIDNIQITTESFGPFNNNISCSECFTYFNPSPTPTMTQTSTPTPTPTPTITPSSSAPSICIDSGMSGYSFTDIVCGHIE